MSKPKITFKMEGTKKVVEQFNAIATKAKKETKEQVNKSALNIQRGAKKRSRVDAGAMRAGWIIEPYQSGFTIDIMNRLEYAIYHEYGTGKYAEHPSIPGRSDPWVYKDPKTGEFVFTYGITAKPMLRPSYDAEKPNFESGIERIFKNL